MNEPNAERLAQFLGALERSQPYVGVQHEAIFREHFIGAGEGETAGYARACVELEGVAKPLALKRGVKP